MDNIYNVIFMVTVSVIIAFVVSSFAGDFVETTGISNSLEEPSNDSLEYVTHGVNEYKMEEGNYTGYFWYVVENVGDSNLTSRIYVTPILNSGEVLDTNNNSRYINSGESVVHTQSLSSYSVENGRNIDKIRVEQEACNTSELNSNCTKVSNKIYNIR